MIVVDCETTGLNPRKNSIVSIGALDFYYPHNKFYEECRIWEGAEIEQTALDVNGFKKEQIKDPNKKSLEQVIKEFLEWTNSCFDIIFAGENPRFDIDFLKESADRYNIIFKFTLRSIDLHSICTSHYIRRGITPPLKDRRTDLNSDKILNYVGLPSEPKPHNALTGAKMEAEAFSRLICGRGLLDEFSTLEIPVYLKIEKNI